MTFSCRCCSDAGAEESGMNAEVTIPIGLAAEVIIPGVIAFASLPAISPPEPGLGGLCLGSEANWLKCSCLHMCLLVKSS